MRSLLPPLGAHVSTAGGLGRAPGRAAALGATAMQIFTRGPQRWTAPELTDPAVRAFREALSATEVRVVVVHDSYLINLATHRSVLFRQSLAAFRAELDRCRRLGVDFVVTHPGHATGGDREVALHQNAAAVTRALSDGAGGPMVLLETTAGGGSALGHRFEEIAALLEQVPSPQRDRVGVCLDTAHVYAAGYDLARDAAGVIDEFERVIGLERLRLLHLNDSVGTLGSHKDRHAGIGGGEIGLSGFAALLQDPRLAGIAGIIETPKGRTGEAADRANLELLTKLFLGEQA